MVRKKKKVKTTARPANTDAVKAPRKGLNMRLQKSILDSRKRTEISKPQAGKTALVILMHPNNELWFMQRMLFWIPAPDGKSRPFTSPKSIKHEAYCPAFQTWRAVANASKAAGGKVEVLKKMEDALGPREEYIVNAFVKDEAGDFRHQLMDLPFGAWRAIMEAIQNEVTEEDYDEDGIVMDPPIVSRRKSRVIFINKTGSGKLGTKYTTSVSGVMKKIPPEEMAKMVDLETLVEPSSTEEIEAALLEYLNVDSLEEFHERLRGGGDTTTKKRAKRRPAVEEVEDVVDEDEDDEEVEEEDDAFDDVDDGYDEEEDEDEEAESLDDDDYTDEFEDEEEEPAPRAKKKRKPVVVEEDDDEDEEEEEVPARKKKSKRASTR